MDSEPTTSPPLAGHPGPGPDDTHDEDDDLRGDLDQALAALDTRTRERDDALDTAHQLRAERDTAREQTARLQDDVRQLQHRLTRLQPRCPAQTPVHGSACRWPAEHTSRHETIGGWTW